MAAEAQGGVGGSEEVWRWPSKIVRHFKTCGSFVAIVSTSVCWGMDSRLLIQHAPGVQALLQLVSRKMQLRHAGHEGMEAALFSIACLAAIVSAASFGHWPAGTVQLHSRLQERRHLEFATASGSNQRRYAIQAALILQILGIHQEWT